MMTSPTNAPAPGTARRATAALFAATGAIVWTHALAATLGHVPSSAAALTVAAIAAIAVGALWTRPARAAVAASAAAGIEVTVIAALDPRALVPALALIPVASTMAAGGAWLARRLPRTMDEILTARPALTAAWVLIAVVAVVHVGRLATYMTDGESDWFLSTRHPFYAKHECFNAYVYGAELDRRGEPNVYDPAHYPGLNPEAEPHTELAGMAPEDPFQYPPPFLLLPRLAIELTHDYQTIRMVWFGLNVTLCLGAVLLLSLWVGGRTGAIGTLLMPFVIASFPVLHNFQYGQFHFAAVALTVLGLLAFATRRTAVGGALLAAAILGKMFPVFLLVPLVAQRRWRELAATAIAGVAIVALTLGVLGTAPFVAFFDDHLPRLSDGQAFAFGEAWPEMATLVTAGNQGIQGVVHKLGALGVPGMDRETAKAAANLFSLLLLGVGVLVGLRTAEASRPERAVAWLGLIGLATLASGGAWADYVPLTAVWALTLLAPMVVAQRASTSLKLTLGLAGALSFSLLGTMPLGELASATWLLPVSLLGALLLLVTFGSAVMVVAPVPVPVRVRSAAAGNRLRR